MVDINWNLLGGARNVGQSVMQGYEQGRQRRREEQLDQAFRYLGENPDDPRAVNALMAADPRLGLQFRGQQMQQRQQMAEQQRAEDERQIKIFGRAARMAKDPASWDAIIDQLAPHYPEVMAYKGKFDPNLRAALMAQAGEKDESENQPSNVQEYEFARQQGFQGSYMDFLETKRGPIVANNGDGTFTLIPRGFVPGGGSVPPPPPGFILDSDGGPTPPASGTFQP